MNDARGGHVNRRQDVNLYLPSLRPQRDYLSARYCLGGLGAATLILLLLALLQHQGGRSLQSDIASQKQQVTQLQQQLAELKQNLPRSQATQLDNEIADLRQQLERRRAISQLIDGRSMGNTEGFAGQMTGLAQSISSELSIHGFELQQGGKLVAVRGRTSLAREVPLYVEKLRALHNFRDSSFGQLSIRRREDSTLLDFSFDRDDSDG